MLFARVDYKIKSMLMTVMKKKVKVMTAMMMEKEVIMFRVIMAMVLKLN